MSRSRMIILMLICLCCAVVYAWVFTPKQRRVASVSTVLNSSNPQQKEAALLFSPVASELNLSGIDTQYQPPRRNIFKPLYLSPSPNTKKTAIVTPKVRKTIVSPSKGIQVVAKTIRPEPIQTIKVLGYLSKAEGYTVFLSSPQGDVYLVKSGDVFAEDLIVKKVDNREITIVSMQTDEQVVLPFGEAKSQRLPKVKIQSNRPEFKLPLEPSPTKLNSGDEPEPNSKKAEK